MITISYQTTILTIGSMMILAKNPIKLSMMLLLLSSLIFSYMAVSTGSAWFPLLMSLLFMGGILMMFMMISSVLPNEKSWKMKMFYLLVPLIPLSMSKSNPSKLMDLHQTTEQLKSLMMESSTMWLMMVILILYFFLTILMLSKSEMPMRSVI